MHPKFTLQPHFARLDVGNTLASWMRQLRGRDTGPHYTWDTPIGKSPQYLTFIIFYVVNTGPRRNGTVLGSIMHQNRSEAGLRRPWEKLGNVSGKLLRRMTPLVVVHKQANDTTACDGSYHHTPPVCYEASMRNCHQDGNYVIDRRKLLRCVTTRLRLRCDYVTVLKTDTQIVYSREEHADSRMIAWDSLQLGLYIVYIG